MANKRTGGATWRRARVVAVAASAAAVLGASGLTWANGAPASASTQAGGHHAGIKHVLLISADGLHQQYLA